MISRSAFRQLNHSVSLLLGAIVGLLLTYLMPAVLGLAGSYVALSAWAIMGFCYAPMVRFYGLNILWALTLPLTACFYLAATVYSAISYWLGRGGAWKGRDTGSATLATGGKQFEFGHRDGSDESSGWRACFVVTISSRH